MAFVIEQGVAPPVKKRTTKYPFAAMKPGDSFHVPFDGKEPLRLQSSLCTSARQALGAGGFKTAQEGDGVRVWRIR